VPLRRCLTCRRLTRNGSYCELHARKPPSPSSRSWHQPGAARVRAQVRARDGHRCTVCGTTEDLKVHHLIDAADGGPLEPWNLTTLCGVCHRDAHRKT